MLNLEQERAFVDRRSVRFHLSFLQMIADPERRGRHQVVLEEPGWRILLWCLLRGMGRSFRRARRPALPQGVHAMIGNPDRTAALLGLKRSRFEHHLDRGVVAGLWRIASTASGSRQFLELSPGQIWVGDHLARRRAMAAWGLAVDDSHFLQVEGFFLRQVLLAHTSGAGLGSASPIAMTPSDWRFLFQMVLARVQGGIRWEGRPARFEGSLRGIAERLGLSHTALRSQLHRIQAWETSLGVSSPLSIEGWVENHPQRPAFAGLEVWINPLWFQLPSKAPKHDDQQPPDGTQVIVRRRSPRLFATDQWHRRFASSR